MRRLGSICAVLAAALVVATPSSATVPIGADVELGDNGVSTPSRPHSSGLVLDVLSCAQPTVSCPQPASLTIRGPRTMKVFPDNVSRRCDVGSPPDPSSCPAESKVGSGTASLFTSGVGETTAPITAYATSDTTHRKLVLATFTRGVTWMGSAMRIGPSVSLKFGDLSFDQSGPLEPTLTELQLSLDRTKRIKVRRKHVERHLFGNPSICWKDKWRFRVKETFSSPADTGRNTSTEPCRAR